MTSTCSWGGYSHSIPRSVTTTFSSTFTGILTPFHSARRRKDDELQGNDQIGPNHVPGSLGKYLEQVGSHVMPDIAGRVHADVHFDALDVAGPFLFRVDVTRIPDDLLEFVQLLASGAAWPHVLADDLADFLRFGEGVKHTGRRFRLTFPEHIGKSLDVRGEIVAVGAPVDLQDVASLDDSFGIADLAAVRQVRIGRGVPGAQQSHGRLLFLQPPRDVVVRGNLRGDDLVGQGPFLKASGDVADFREFDDLARHPLTVIIGDQMLSRDKAGCILRSQFAFEEFEIGMG